MLLLSSCSSGGQKATLSESNLSLSQSQIAAKLQASLDSVSGVHVKGVLAAYNAITSVFDQMPIDMQFNKDGSGSGILTLEDGVRLPVIEFSGTVYFQMTAQYLQAQLSPIGAYSTVTPTVKKLYTRYTNEWASSISGVGELLYRFVGADFSFAGMEARFVPPDVAGYAYEGSSASGARKSARYRLAYVKSLLPSTLVTLPASGSALPMQASMSASFGESLTFTWDKPTVVTPPPAASIVAIPNNFGEVVLPPDAASSSPASA
ncbi:hypothetical protein KDL01_39350 [Actinospica durhamensis]|uniref:Uncharacterized protein n=1 Tax=Actinospica durhamensis TaxID=1508375 RepID=A0A941IVH6_9ACTN|nr:hypothetical protein [Actinospica durhamensis]MBR7839383.1 hypothetical protein [Actinospica durhamensis]